MGGDSFRKGALVEGCASASTGGVVEGAGQKEGVISWTLMVTVD